jgi:isoleucyl-tRNA synthetase
LWVAAEDYREDIRISQEILKRLTEMYRKVRNTVRYVLGNVSDFDPNHDLVKPEALLPLDRFAVAVTDAAVARMREAYATATFHQVVQTMNELCTIELSSFYFDILKDRLYCSRKNSPMRRSAQTALYLIGRDLLRVLSPILCFTTEEAWGYLPRLAGDADSVHLQTYPGVNEPAAVTALKAAVAADAERLFDRFGFVRELREKTNLALEQARQQKRIGSSVEATLHVDAPAETMQKLRAIGEAELGDLLIVSYVKLGQGHAAEVVVQVENAQGTKCARCWLYRDDLGQNTAHPTICGRCAEAM